MLWNESRNSLTFQSCAEYFFCSSWTVLIHCTLAISPAIFWNSFWEGGFFPCSHKMTICHYPSPCLSPQPSALALWTHSYNCIYATTQSNLVDTDTEGLSVKRGLSVVLFVENKNLLWWSIGFIMFKIAKHSDVSLVPHDPFSHPQKPLGISSKPIS